MNVLPQNSPPHPRPPSGPRCLSCPSGGGGPGLPALSALVTCPFTQRQPAPPNMPWSPAVSQHPLGLPCLPSPCLPGTPIVLASWELPGAPKHPITNLGNLTHPKLAPSVPPPTTLLSPPSSCPSPHLTTPPLKSTSTPPGDPEPQHQGRGSLACPKSHPGGGASSHWHLTEPALSPPPPPLEQAPRLPPPPCTNTTPSASPGAPCPFRPLLSATSWIRSWGTKKVGVRFGGVLAGSVVWEWGAAECWMVEQENLGPQGGGVTGPPHRGFYIKGLWGGGHRSRGAQDGDVSRGGAHPAYPSPQHGYNSPHPKSPGL